MEYLIFHTVQILTGSSVNRVLDSTPPVPSSESTSRVKNPIRDRLLRVPH